MENKYDENGLLQLRNAIILQAVADYETAIAVLSTEYSPKDLEQELTIELKKCSARKTKAECEGFFKSKLYGMMTKIDGDAIKSMIINGINNAGVLVYNIDKGYYTCECGNRLAVNTLRLKRQQGSPMIKCTECKRYYRGFGKPIKVE